MESEHVVAVIGMVKLNMRTFLRNDLPALSLQGPEDDAGLGAGPLPQAEAGRMTIESGILLDFSTSSATA